MKCVENMKALAERGHEGQVRKDGKTPYAEHPRAVAALLDRWGVDDAATLAIAWGHDLLEDTDVSEAEIRRAAGPRHAAAVLAGIKALTRDRAAWPDKREWLKHVARTAPPAALLVKAADRICNARDFLALGDPGKARDYLAQGAPVFALAPEGETVARELEALRAEIDAAGADNKIHRVMWGREEHPLTVFVPWDCGHRCPFCTTKREYETLYPEMYLERNFSCLKESMRRILEYDFIDEVVFTGGEPLADVERLEELIGLAGDRSVYINTSLNLDERKTEEAIRFLVRANNRKLDGDTGVSGISVSFPFANVRMVNANGYQALKRLFENLDYKPFNWCRINSIVRGTETPEQIRMFLADLSELGKERRESWSIWSVNLRKDYTTCDQTNLNDCCDCTMKTLMSMPDLHYIGHGGCLVCRNDVFAVNDESEANRIPRLTYHRGVEFTSLRYGDFLVVNDLVIKPDGEIRYDWRSGTLLPKRVMDTIAGPGSLSNSLHEEDPEWKWKNSLFAERLTVGGDANGMGCRDRPYERCG